METGQFQKEAEVELKVEMLTPFLRQRRQI